jgi:hypothetical protein
MFEKQKRCPKCSATFDCGGLLGCWCWKVKLDRPALAALKQQYDDCLCPQCLGQISENSRPNGAGH